MESVLWAREGADRLQGSCRSLRESWSWRDVWVTGVRVEGLGSKKLVNGGSVQWKTKEHVFKEGIKRVWF